MPKSGSGTGKRNSQKKLIRIILMVPTITTKAMKISTMETSSGEDMDIDPTNIFWYVFLFS